MKNNKQELPLAFISCGACGSDTATSNELEINKIVKEITDENNHLKKALRGLLNKVNRVTCMHRHGREVSEKGLTELSNRQLDCEAIVSDNNIDLWDRDE